MSEIRFITSSDEHVAEHVGFRKDDYKSAILKKLEWQGQIARQFEANAVLRGGDFFDVKAANKTTMRTLEATAQIHNAYHCPTYALAGNHDMSYNDPTTLPGQPLGVMFASGVFKRLTDQTFESGSLKVRVVGVDYTVDLDTGALHDAVRKKDENITIAFVHALAAMAPEEKIQSFFNEKIFDYRDLVFDGCPDIYIFGHYHKDQGIQEVHGTKFINLGAVSRGALTFENLERKPKISMIKVNSQGVSVEEHIIPHEDAADIFDLDKKKRLDHQRKDLNDFISMLQHNASISGIKSVDLIKDNIKQLPEDLRKLALDVLESAESGALDDN